MTQKETVLKHLKDYGKITSLEAVFHYRITRLSARIWELRHEGYPIISRRITKKQDGKTVSYDEYFFGELI